MAWLTIADSTNKIIDSSGQRYEYLLTFFGNFRRLLTTTQARYVGVAISSAAGLTTSLAATSGTRDAHYQENGDGSATIYHTTETSSGWESF